MRKPSQMAKNEHERIDDVVSRLKDIIHNTPLDDKVKLCVNDAIELLCDLDDIDFDTVEWLSDSYLGFRT